jgi:hypothetical protein
LSREIEALRQRIGALSGDPYSYQYRVTLSRQMSALAQERSTIASSLRQQSVRQCNDPVLYFVADGDTQSYPCRYSQAVY